MAKGTPLVDIYLLAKQQYNLQNRTYSNCKGCCQGTVTIVTKTTLTTHGSHISRD